MYEKIVKGEDLKIGYAGSEDRHNGLVWVISALQNYLLLEADGMPAGSNTYKIGDTTLEIIESHEEKTSSKGGDGSTRRLLESITIQIDPEDTLIISEIESSIASHLR